MIISVSYLLNCQLSSNQSDILTNISTILLHHPHLFSILHSQTNLNYKYKGVKIVPAILYFTINAMFSLLFSQSNTRA